MIMIRKDTAIQPKIGFLDSCAISDIGSCRENNEDNFVLNRQILTDFRAQESIQHSSKGSNWNVYGVFDGIGGNEKGELASREAAREFSLRWLDGCSDKSDASRQMLRCFQDAEAKIRLLQRQYPGCGTTGTVACCREQEFKIYSEGDSRAYLFRCGKLFQLTQDHTLAQMKRKQGIAPLPRDSHILTAYLGSGRILPAESQWIPFQNGDRLLLCTDGLYHSVDDSHLCQTLSLAQTPQNAAQALVKLALKQGGQDNTTVIIVDYKKI